MAINPDLVLLGITAIWGLTFVVVKDALALADPLTFLALRFGVGALVCAALARGQLLHRPTLWNGLRLALLLFLGFAFQTWGLLFTTPSRSAFITGLSVVLVPLVSLLLFRRVPGRFSLLGVLLALIGLYLLTLGASADSAQAVTPEMLRGDALTLACAVAYAFHITFTERFAKASPALPLVAVQLAVVSLLSLVCLAFFPHRLSPQPALWGGVLLTGVLASALAISLQTWAQARTSAVRAALIFSLEPVFAAGYSVVLGREKLGFPELTGGSLILGGVVTAELGPLLFRR